MASAYVNQDGHAPQWEIRLRSVDSQLGAAEQRVVDYIKQHQSDILSKSIAEVATACDVSDATVVRFCRRLGYTGLKEFKIAMAQEQIRPAQEMETDLDWDDPLPDARQKIFRGGMMALSESMSLVDDAAMEQAAQLLATRYVHIYASGGSAIPAAYLKRQLMKLGRRVDLFDTIHSMSLSLAQLVKGKDVVVAISCSGEEDSVVDSAQWAKSQGIETIVLTDHPNSLLGQHASVLLNSTGGSTFMGDQHFYSRLAQMAVVNLLYVGTALVLGPDAIDKVRLKGQSVRKMIDG